MTSPVLSEARDGWRRITLNRPDKLNAFDLSMHKALAAALDEAEADPGCRVILLTGAGRGFCAGQDLDAITADAIDVRSLLRDYYNPMVRRLRGLPIPVVCAVNGTAAGAGVSVALACDIALAAKSARFIQAFSKIGLVPDCGGTWFPSRVVGEARARALALLGEPVPAETAERWGLIWRAVEDDALPAEAEAVVARLAALPSAALGLTKRALAAAPDATLDSQLELEAELQLQAAGLDDHKEAVRAFLEKRPPRFGGRAA